MTNHPIAVLCCRVRRFVRDFKPELRVRANGSVGVYRSSEAQAPAVNLSLDQDFALPLLKAAGILAALVFVARLFRR